MARRLLLVAAAALATAGPAAAHAVPLHVEPPPGATLLTAPQAVFVTFDGPVRVGPRTAAIRNDGPDVLGGRPRVEHENRLVIPLRAGLADGDYSVRWSVVSDDGHEEEGVVAFAVGTAAPPVAALTTKGSATWQRVAMRGLLLLGMLGAAGGAFYSAVVLGGALPRRLAHLLFGFFLSAFAGADALVHASRAGGTRFERFTIAAAVAAGAGAAAAALVPREPRLRPLVWAAAAVLFVCPTLAGHALDPGQPEVIAPAADLLHAAGAAVWLGGVAALALARVGTVERFAGFALPAVLVVGLGGAARALTELSSFPQLWETGYGRALLVKTGLFACLLALAWLARRGLALVQLALLAAVAVAVGALTDLRPGRARPEASGQPPAAPVPPPGPPPGAFVDAGQAGPLAVGFAWASGRATVTLVGPEGGGATGERVTIDGRSPAGCGDGCYAAAAGRSVRVTVGGRTLRFAVPASPRSGAAALRRARRLYDAAPALTIVERLSSGPGRLTVTVLHERAPDRLSLRVRSATQPGAAGTEDVVIGNRRFRRGPGGAWTSSPQAPLHVPQAYWTPAARNVWFTGPRALSFYDPALAAWFRLRLDPAGRPSALTMVARAHFMHHDYSFRSPAISPPSR